MFTLSPLNRGDGRGDGGAGGGGESGGTWRQVAVAGHGHGKEVARVGGRGDGDGGVGGDESSGRRPPQQPRSKACDSARLPSQRAGCTERM